LHSGAGQGGQQGERRAPTPIGLLTGKRTRLRRVLSLAAAHVNRFLDLLPPGKWLHRRVHRGLEMPDLELPLRRGGAGLHGLRLAFLSDLHAGSFLDAGDLARIFTLVAEQEPDLVCFGGDLINSRERELQLFREPLKILRPPLGMYAVPGNHDHFWGSDIGRWTAFLEEQGVRVMTNKGVRLQRDGSPFWLCGVDDLTEGEPDLRQALQGRHDEEPAVLLSHHPDFFFEAAAADVDLTLSGHTHGGQIRIGSWAPLHHSRLGYQQGWFEAEGCKLYVGRGVGVTLLPLRIGAPPEIPMVRFAAPVATGREVDAAASSRS
jgi:hypothetical protein